MRADWPVREGACPDRPPCGAARRAGARGREVPLEGLLDRDRDPLARRLEPARVDPRARSRSVRPTARAAARVGRGRRGRRGPDRGHPGRGQPRLGTGPDTREGPHGNGARKAASVPAGTTVIPPGLRRSEATLATTFVGATPSEHDRLVAALTEPGRLRRPRERGRSRRRARRSRGSPRRARCARRVGLPRARPSTPPANTRGTACAGAGRRSPRTAAQCFGAAHRRVDPEAASDVVRGRDDATALGIAADDERPTAQLRPLELLHGREERVQIEMGEDRHDASMIDAPAASTSTGDLVLAPREVSFGLVAGVAPEGTRQIIVRVGKHNVAQEPLRGRTFSLNVPMHTGVVEVRVTAVDGRNRRSTSVVGPVFALPLGSDPRQRASRLDLPLARTVRSLVARHGGRPASTSRISAPGAAPRGMHERVFPPLRRSSSRSRSP